MKTNWYGLTTLQHLSKMAHLWFATPFTKYFWKTLFEDDYGAGYMAFGIFFMGICFTLLWVTTPILFPIIFLVSRLYCYKKARKMVINALRSK
jgi:hypothetical protein